MRNNLIIGSLILILLFSAAVCSAQEQSIITGLSKIDNTAWLYNADDDVYYQLGIAYCETPADESYENLAVFVPGAYMNAVSNGNDTYTCTINTEAEVNGYTALTAPIVMPINTPGYSAMSPLSSYTSLTSYMNAGFVYVHAGCRGRDAGAPAGVTDLKAAVRYIRYSADTIPGSTDRIFTFGMSGGGAQSALMGSTGDSTLYDPYLEAIGAVQGVSDAVLGSMCWCPITNLDSANEAYEWMMGVTRSGLSDDEQAISDNLAAAFASYINAAGIKDNDGNVLTLEASDSGIYQAGSYYGYILQVISRSLTNFLHDTEFPYDASSSSSSFGGRMGGGRPEGMPEGGFGGRNFGDRNFEGGMSGGEIPADGEFPQDAEAGSDAVPETAEALETAGNTEEEINYEAIDDITRNETESSLTISGTYDTPQDYIDALNANGEWVSYDADTNTASVLSVADFVKAFKSASKNLGAFDQLDGGQGENTLFGYGDGNGAHFDAVLADILTTLGSEYADSYAADLTKTDSAGNTVDIRLNMYTPLYYLLESEEGFGSSSVAKYWRIRTGIAQGDCALSTEVDLALALQNYEGVGSVDFETIWGAGHTQAERSGNSTDNFITWVSDCLASD